MQTTNKLAEWELIIQEAYKYTNRSNLWLSACLMQEAGELAEHIIKQNGYQKPYSSDQILSEAGDVLNFLTAILHTHDYSLADAMNNNETKLRARGWITRGTI